MSNIFEQAQAYVESADYLSNENRNIAGQAFMAGARWAFEMAHYHADSAAGLTTSLDENTERVDGWNRAAKAIAMRIRAWLE